MFNLKVCYEIRKVDNGFILSHEFASMLDLRSDKSESVYTTTAELITRLRKGLESYIDFIQHAYPDTVELNKEEQKEK